MDPLAADTPGPATPEIRRPEKIAERQIEETVQKLSKANTKMSHMLLTAPVAGTVQALSITSMGQVVMLGEEVMRIVPADDGIEIECYMPNKDIGFIKPGQEAVVKVEILPLYPLWHVARPRDTRRQGGDPGARCPAARRRSRAILSQYADGWQSTYSKSVLSGHVGA